jgi:hypothetical protein
MVEQARSQQGPPSVLRGGPAILPSWLPPFVATSRFSRLPPCQGWQVGAEKFETLQSEIGLGVGLPTKGVESQPKQHGGGKGSWGVSLLGLTMFNEAEALAR